LEPAPLQEDDDDDDELRRMAAAAAARRRRSPKDDDFIPTIRIVYLTARPLSLASTTRRFLQTFHQLSLPRDQEALFGPPLSATRKFLQTLQRKSILENHDKDEDEELHDLPPGPLLCNLHDMRSILVSELVLRDVHHHKVAMLKDQLLLPFQQASLGSNSVVAANGGNPNIMASSCCPLVLGIGNAVTDTMAYNMSGIPLPCIYQINSKGIIVCFDTTVANEEEQSVGHQKDPFAIFEGSMFYGYEDPKLLEHCRRQLQVGIEQQRLC
jgi:phosphatidate phosphatase PAH1